jgi:NADH-ubiquinone oxidoreductase chain 4L
LQILPNIGKQPSVVAAIRAHNFRDRRMTEANRSNTTLLKNIKREHNSITSPYRLFFMNLSLILFLIGILGFVLNRKNIILMLISIEIMLLAITFLILIHSFSFDDILGQVFAIYIIAIAGAESAIGLGILVAFYRLRGSIEIDYK